MTESTLQTIYTTLNGYTSLTSVAEISVGWKSEDLTFPCINIVQAGGSQTGMLGYSSDNKVREEDQFQFNIYSRTSLLQTYELNDTLAGVMISSGYHKITDVDMFDDDLDAHRKTTRWAREAIV